MRNLLLANVQTALINPSYVNFYAENSTFAGPVNFPITPGFLAGASTGGPFTISLKNCVLANLSAFITGSGGTLTGENNGFYNTPPAFGTSPFSPPANPFQTKGAGNYYLTDASGLRNVGTPNIDSTLANDLKKKTTYPPIDPPASGPSTTLWIPVALRDTDVLDLGYHYDPLDYLCSQYTMGGSPHVLTNGVAVGMFGTRGFNITGGGGFFSEGRPDALNRLAWYPSVQEQPVRLSGIGTPYSAIFNISTPTSVKVITLSFTEMAMQGRQQSFFEVAYPYYFPAVSLKDCHLRGLSLAVSSYYVDAPSGPSVSLQNNVLERSSVNLFNGYIQYFYAPGQFIIVQNPLSVNLYNNLFWRSSLILNYRDLSAIYHPTWAIKDNMFDGATISFAGDGNYLTLVNRSHNGFYNTPTSTQLGGTDSPQWTSLSYATGPLGPWYWAASSPTPPTDVGSRTARLAGLYHHTLQLNQQKELSSQVDIGFHYVAVDSAGKPIDTDKDGVADYKEDKNGNGDYEPQFGETPWDTDIVFSPNGGLGDGGVRINLRKDAQGYLKINPLADTAPLPFVNVAQSAKGTVARIRVVPAPDSGNPSTWSTIVGEYYTAPNTRQRDPSRTTVDRYGNIWVGNRMEADPNGGSIACFGVVVGGTRCDQFGNPNPAGQYLKPPFDYNTCVDRHGATLTDPPDGLIKTSFGLNNILPWLNAGAVDSLGGVSTAEDEAILYYLRLVPTAVRTMAIDRDNNLWVGGYNNQVFEFVETSLGSSVTGRRFHFRSGGYGGVVDGYGALWSSGYGPNKGGLMHFVPGASVPPGFTGGVIDGTSSDYGIGVDPATSDIWLPVFGGPLLHRFRADGCGRQDVSFNGNGNGMRGIVVDGRGNVWAAGGDPANHVIHLRTSGEYVGEVVLQHPTAPGVTGLAPLGVSVDSQGMVWAVCNRPSTDGKIYSMRIDPNQGALVQIGSQSYRVGAVVEAVDMGTGSGPYNYSDMTGYVPLAATQPAGVWDFIHDSAVANTPWTSLGLDADLPTGTRAVIEVRAADQPTRLTSWPFRGVNSFGVMPANTKGRYLEIRVNLLRDFGVLSEPAIRGLTLNWESSAPCTLQITSHPKNKSVSAGQSAIFDVQVTPPAGVPATYQWLKNGVAISGAVAASYTINNAQYSDAAKYSVRVTAGTGCVLESAVARLFLKGNAPVVTVEPASVTSAAGQNVQFTSKATVTAVAGDLGAAPVYYQWRLGHMPVVGGSGQCVQEAGGAWVAQLTVNAQCNKVGDYSVIFWNQYGEVLSANGTLTVTGSPALSITPPSVAVVNESQNVTLTAVACFEVQCVQWFKGTGSSKVAIPGATQLAYTIPPPVTCDELGSYTVVVVDKGWRSYEATANVTSSGGISLASATVQFTPENIGTGTWTYQWSSSQDDSTYVDISGATSSSYAIPFNNVGANAYYRVVATRAGATAEARLNFNSSSFWLEAISTLSGSLNVTLSAQASQVGPWGWYFLPEGSGVEQNTGVSGTQYTLNMVDCPKRGRYTIRSVCGTASASSTIYVRTPGVSIGSTTVQINPNNIGTGTWIYQWASSSDDINYSDIPGAVAATYGLPVNDSSANKYYRVVATRTGATATLKLYYDSNNPYVNALMTESCTLSVTYAPKVVGVVGAGSWTYRWFFTPEAGGAEQDKGASTGPYTISPVDCTKRGTYRVRLTDACNQTANAYAYLYVATPTVTIGSTTVQINPNNIGTGTWTYQWASSTDDVNYSNIPGAVAATYTLPVNDSSANKYYRVVATRTGASASVRLYYDSFTPYVQQVATQNGTLGVTYTPLPVGVVGTGSWGYHWYFTPEAGGAEQDRGVSSGPYTITPVDCTKRGTYRVQLNDVCANTANAYPVLYVNGCP